MGRFDKVKNFFVNIFRRQKLLGSGEDIQSESDSGENRDLFQERKDKFDVRVQVDLSQKQEEWKEPVFGQATFLYKGRRLPKSIWLGDTITQENAEYLGENKYSIKTDNLSLEDTYKLTAQLVNRTADAVREIIFDASEQYEQSSHKPRIEIDFAKCFAKEGETQRAIESLDDVLLSQFDYNDASKQHEYEQSSHKLRIEIDFAKCFAKEGETQIATERLDAVLLSQLDYYDELMKRDERIDRTGEDLGK